MDSPAFVLLVAWLVTLVALVAYVLRHRNFGKRVPPPSTLPFQEDARWLSATLRSIGDGVISCDRQGVVCSLNTVAERLTGWNTDAAAGRPIHEVFPIIHARSRQSIANPVERAIRDGQVVNLANQTVLIARDGSERQIADSCAPICDESGRILGAVLVFRDVTEQYATRKRLRELAAITEQTIEGVAMTDSAGKIRYMNEAWAKMHGYPAREPLYGQSLRVFHTEEQYEEQVVPFLKAIHSRGSHRGRVNHRRRDGSIFPTQMVGTQITDPEGDSYGLVGFAQDISELSREEEQRQFRVEFLRMLTAASTALTIATNDDEIDQALEPLLRHLGEMFGADRTYLFRFSADLVRMTNTHEWCAAGIESQKTRCRNQPMAAMRWWKQRMLECEVVHLPDVHALPPDAEVEKQEFLAQGIRSLLCLPTLSAQGMLTGFLGCDMVRRHYRWSDEHIHLLQLAADTVGGALERRRAADALEESEAKFRSLIANMPGMAYRCRNDAAWTMLYLSDHVQDICGYPPRDFLHNAVRSYESVIYREDTERVAETIREAIAADRAWQIDYRVLHRDGSVRWVHEKGVGRRDAHGQVRLLDGFVLDITQRRQMEDLLRVSEQHLRNYIEHAPYGVFLANENGAYEEVNPAACQITGYSASELQAKRVGDLLAEDSWEIGMQAWQTVWETGRHECELAFRHKSGQRRWWVLSAVRLGEARVLGFFHETTARREAEQRLRDINQRLLEETMRANEMAAVAREASVAKSEFLARMSHELLTPMNGVNGNLELLKTSALNQAQQTYVAIIQRSSQALLNLIRELLDFSKAETGALELEHLDFDLQEMLDELVAGQTPEAQNKGLPLLCDVAAEVPSRLRGDPDRLAQALGTLVNNAIKFTSQGEVRIQVNLDRQGAHQATLRFTVRDTGIGIPEEQLDKVFDTFFIVDSSTTRCFGGTGLGLAVCRHLVRLFHGEIGVSSHWGEGSEFWFTACLEKQGAPIADGGCENPLEFLPPPREPDPTRPAPSQARSADTGDPDVLPQFSESSIRILLAEDNPINQQVLQGILEKMGLATDLAETGKEAVQKLAAQPYDLVLMDCQMPTMDGYQATERIRDPGSSVLDHEIPIIAITAFVMQGSREKCLAAGMNDYLPKPVSPGELAEKLEQWLPIKKRAKPFSAEPPQEESRGEGERETVSVWEADALRERLMGDEEIFRSIVISFQSDLEDQIQHLDEQFQLANMAGIRRQAHTLKGTAATVSAEALRTAAWEVEQAARNEDTSAVLTALNHVRAEAARLRHIMQEACSDETAEL